MDEARTLGLEVRAGLHTGECELMEDDVAGVAVHIASRIVSLAAPGEVLASSTVRDLVAGSAIEFVGRGAHALRGAAASGMSTPPRERRRWEAPIYDPERLKPSATADPDR